MHIIICGAGITGIQAAYYLGRAGHQVEVIDRQPSPALECSFANGGQLSYSHAEPWANPYVLGKVFKWMWQEDAPLVLRFSTDPHMIRWGLHFLWNCRKTAAEKSSRTMLRLGLFSKQKMAELVAETGIEFDHSHKGILHVFSNEAEFEHAQRQAEFQKTQGCEERILSWQECVALEPALASSSVPIFGGIHAPMDENGDIHLFTHNLADYCAKHFNTQFHFNTEILDLNSENGRITHVSTNRGNMRADAFVMAMGAYSSIYMRRLGINLPIYPMKGYSITLPASDDLPSVSITDDALKIVYSRLGNRVRVAGTAEFARYNTEVREARIAPMIRGINSLFPKANTRHYDQWACLRPATPDGPPIVGKTTIENLYINSGHGTLGWTQGAGTASLLADVIEGRQPQISLDGLLAARY